MTPEQKFEKSYRCISVKQPIGEFYIASIPAKELVMITEFDVRRVMMEERDVERYLGIQRELNPARVKTISSYVRTMDACFPTAVIIAVRDRCVGLDDDNSSITLTNWNQDDTDVDDEQVLTRQIARVLDGQHRLAGLAGMEEEFDINVSIFVDADIADQAAIFSTVNLAQTKVNKSLTYDLFELMSSRSPQKTCHNIIVTLDREEDSPFHKMIKRLGKATPGRTGETLTQATVVEPILRYVSADPMGDRDSYLRKKKPEKIGPEKLEKHPFQHMFVDEKDFEITDVVWNYFSAIRDRWPEAWTSRERGVMINRTNGYKAFMRVLAPLYMSISQPGRVPTIQQFTEEFDKVELEDGDFNTDNFAPGTSGESDLFHKIQSDIGLEV